MVIEDDDAKGESEKKEQLDDTWQDEEFFAKKVNTKKAESEPVISEEFEKLDKKLEKLHVFMKSKGMDHKVRCDSEQSFPCLPIEPFEHNGKTYPGLENFTDVMDILAVEPKGQELKKEEKEEENEQEEEGNEKVSTEEEDENPTDQVLKAIRACIEESFEEDKSPSDVLISVSDNTECIELSMLFNEMNFNFAYLFDVFLDGSIYQVDKLMRRFDINSSCMLEFNMAQKITH
ncbi:hypothetical protein JCGZ_25678 [Jatropha curcas]|uniref:Uncharacterized protein n=1 Tax=Jatropha curcas TaxID=180498 RepID=A0A067LRC8_JATCU|nr:hypothetical protein JCGZ_25678 [Jatropha curcas]